MKFYYMKTEPMFEGDQLREASFREIIPHFCKQSTVHGLQHVGRTSGYIKLIGWLLLLAGCTAGLTYNAYAITSSYLDFLVYVKIDVHDSKELDFPAVTVCNTNPIKRSDLYLSPRMEALVASWKSEGGTARRRRRKRDTCPNPVEPVSGVCFWREETDRITQAEARQHCLDIGANLAVVDTQEKFTHIFQTPLQLASAKSVWLDLKYNSATGTWQWAESVDLAWSNWESDPGTPPSDPDKECVYVSFETDQLTWRNVECDGVHKFMVFGLRPLCMDGDIASVETTTQTETTTIAETTTEDISTTAEETTTIQATTKSETTQQETTTSLQTTTSEHTTTEATSTQVMTSTAEVTTITTSLPYITTEGKTTDSPTTLGITTPEITTEGETTNVPTSKETTTLGITTEEPTSTDITTKESTLAETTTSSTTIEIVSTEEAVGPVVNADGKVLREDFKREGDVMRVLSEIPEEEKKMLGYKYPEFVLECSFNGRVCTELDFEPFFDAVHGNCYVFNSGWNQSRSLYTATLSGRQRGFHILMNVGQHEYITSVGKQAGVVAVVHDQTRMPFPEDEGILGTPGYVTSVGIKKVSVERLGSQYSDCITDTDGIQPTAYTQLYGVNYTVTACEKNCYQDYVIAQCACADPQYPTLLSEDDEVPACDVRNKTQGDCVNALTLLYIEDKLNCSCPLPCSAIMYTYRVSKTMWPSDRELDSLIAKYGGQLAPISGSATMEETVRRNLLRLEVYFEELNYRAMKEAPKYPLARYISGLGAIIGLWLGCSVLSLLEIIEVVSDTLYLTSLKLLKYLNGKQNKDDKNSMMSPSTLRKRVSPLALGVMEMDPDNEDASGSTSVSVYHNPTFQGSGAGGRRVRSRRRSTLDNIFAVARPNASHMYEINRLIPGRDEGYSSEEGSPVPGLSTKGTIVTTHVAQLHVPPSTPPETPSGKFGKHDGSEESKQRARHERFLFGSS